MWNLGYIWESREGGGGPEGCDNIMSFIKAHDNIVPAGSSRRDVIKRVIIYGNFIVSGRNYDLLTLIIAC